MTISSTTRKAGPYYGNGLNSVFTFAFKVFQASDVFVVTTFNGVDTTAVLGTQYNVTLNADQTTSPGGTVTFVAPLAAGVSTTIGSKVPNLQSTDLTNLGGFYPKVINDALDRATIQIQQLAERLDRTYTYSFGSGTVTSAATAAPVPNSIVGIDANGNITYITQQTQVTTAAFSNFRTDVFSGNGSTTQFTLSNDPGSVNNLDIGVGGIVKIPGIDFNVVGTQVTFVNPPATGFNNISIRYGAALTAIGAGNYSGYSRTVPIVIPWAVSITVNASLSNVFYVDTLLGNTTVNISNPNDGQTINVRFKQDTTGSRTVTVAGSVFVNGSINSASGAICWLILTYVSAETRWEGIWSTSPSNIGLSIYTAPDAATIKTILGITGSGVYAAMGANTDITSLASPFIGDATAATQMFSDNSTKVATTAMVQAAIAGGGGAAAGSGANTDITSLASPFLGSATATTQSAADNTTKVATTAMVQAALAANPGSGLGTSQAWQIMSGKALATTYTNSTGKPIFVTVSVTVTGGGDGTYTFTPTVAGVTLPSISAFRFSTGSAVNFSGYPFIVPNGATYSVNCTNPVGAVNAIQTWAELR